MSRWFRSQTGAPAAVLLLACTLFGGAGRAVAPDATAQTYGPVGASETLWSVAKKFKTGRGTTSQMAWALFRANPEAFEGSATRMRSGSTLKVPDAAFVKQVSNKEAYAALTGKAPASAAEAPAPTKRKAAVAAGPAPVVTGVELTARGPGEPYQWFSVVGTGFAPGAMLELRDLSQRRPSAPRKPQSIRATRIEYAAEFPERASRWQVAVRNPDGSRSAPYEFDGGAHVTLTLAPTTAAVVAAVPSPLVTVPNPAAAFAGSSDQAKAMQMLQAGESADAVYRFLAPLEERYAGDVDYDYRLGTSAFDSGRFGEAIFILQRAVSSRPQFSGARMELARAYYAQGDNESARREFTTLQDENPPPEARRVIAEYLGAIDRRAAVYQTQLGAYVDLASGYDTNANGAPDTQTFLGFSLDSRNQATSSAYYSLGLGGSGSYPFAPTWRALGNAGASYRSNPDASFVDSQLAQLAGGLEWRPGAFTVTALPGYTYAMLDGKENHHALGVDTSGAYNFDTVTASLNVHYAQQRYVDALSAEDVNTLIYGVATQMNLQTARPVQVGAAATAGKDTAVEPLQPFGRKITGARVFALVDFGQGHSVTLGAGTLKSDYDGTFFGQPRNDTQLNTTLGYEWGAFRASGWTVDAHVTYVNNSSTVLLYDYNRVDAGLALRKDFK